MGNTVLGCRMLDATAAAVSAVVNSRVLEQGEEGVAAVVVVVVVVVGGREGAALLHADGCIGPTQQVVMTDAPPPSRSPPPATVQQARWDRCLAWMQQLLPALACMQRLHGSAASETGSCCPTP